METLTVGLVSIATAILILGFEPVVGTSHWGLLNYDVTWFMQMTVWYCESYLPVKYTKQKLALMKEIVPTSHKLEKTLVDEELLLKFELHLIDEWSPENLQKNQKRRNSTQTAFSQRKRKCLIEAGTESNLQDIFPFYKR
mmetsp:Transcript_16233/g.25960  ORF Transcript_16233/g.25960 Transcript_16233/m.25960 type:complete len:140 (-) Transcript_16233:361-780(-)